MFVNCYPIPRRWIISILGTYSCALMFAQRASISVAMVRMTHSNLSMSTAPTFDWSDTLQGIILGSSFYLYWIVPIIVGSYAERFGGKWLAFIGVFIPCLLTALTPLAAATSVGLLIFVQISIGAAQGFTYPSLFHLYVQWFPPQERSKANSGIQIGVALGCALIYLIGGYLCESSIGWPMVFYVCSALHVPWIILWLWLASDKPKIDLDDLNSIKIDQKNQEQTKINKSAPWISIFKSPVVWSSIISKCAGSFGFFMILNKLPAYIDQVFDMPIVENGFINSGTSFAYGITCFLAPYLSNYLIKKQYLSLLTTRKVFQTMATVVPAICLILISFFNEQVTIVIVLLVIAMLGYGFVTGGEWTMVSEYAPNYVGQLSGYTLMLGFFTGIISPYFVGLILDSNIGTLELKWNISFFTCSGFYLISIVVFLLFSTDQQQSWDKNLK